MHIRKLRLPTLISVQLWVLISLTLSIGVVFLNKVHFATHFQKLYAAITTVKPV